MKGGMQMLTSPNISDRYFLSDKEHTYTGWLYKYMSNLDFIKKSITDKTIYLSHPSRFNDPFDGGFTITTNSIGKLGCSPSFFYELVGGLLQKEETARMVALINSDDTPLSIENIIEIIADTSRRTQMNSMAYMAFQMNQYTCTGEQPTRTHFDSRLKIFCFSQTRESFPMWAHYANNHQGVCLEYDAKDIMLTDLCEVPAYALTPVVYTEKFATDDIENYMAHFSKSNQWSYEEEVRIVCQMEGNVLKFPYLKSVNLGADMPKEIKAELVDLCLDNGVDVNCAETSTDGNYALSFVRRGDILKKYLDRGLKQSINSTIDNSRITTYRIGSIDI